MNGLPPVYCGYVGHPEAAGGRPPACAATASASRLLSKRIALPIFASDPLSSVAYATQEILLVLTLGGLAYLYLAPWIGLAVVVLLAVVVVSYRQVVRAYPSGGGSYEVASRNLGRRPGSWSPRRCWSTT